MAKHTTQFKLDVVQQYLNGTAGYKLVAGRHALDHELVRRWVGLYRLHGAAGLEKKFSHYSAEFKLSVLRHMWDNELSCGQTAALFNIRSQGSISVWERWYHSGGINALMPRQRGKPKKMPDSQPPKKQLSLNDETRTREELLAEVSYLRMENAYLKKLKALVQSQQQLPATAHKKRK